MIPRPENQLIYTNTAMRCLEIFQMHQLVSSLTRMCNYTTRRGTVPEHKISKRDRVRIRNKRDHSQRRVIEKAEDGDRWGSPMKHLFYTFLEETRTFQYISTKTLHQYPCSPDIPHWSYHLTCPSNCYFHRLTPL